MTRRLPIRRQLFATAALALCAGVLALGGAANAAPDSKGTDHWLMFTGNLETPTLSLFITSDVSTSGTVAIPGLGVTTPFTVTGGAVTTVSIPTGAEVLSNDVVETKGIHVTAADEVTVYGLSQAQFTTDAFLGLPTDVLGQEHLVLAYRNGGVVQGTQFGVVAPADDTSVTITPSVTTGTRAAGVPYTVVLDAGQTYQLRNETSLTADLSGTLITSDKPVAVFGGHFCANVPPTATFCDHVVEQIPATNTWGESFVTVPLATRVGGDTFRVLASANGTTVSVNGTTVATLARGQVHEQIVTGAAVIEASNPVLVAQYSNGTSFDNVTSDPFMMLVPPSEQFLAEYTITTPAVVFETNFVNVVVPTTAIASMRLDGAPIPPASFTAIGSSGFSGAQLPVSVGSHRLQGSLPFGVFAYGFASFDSYGYPGGASFSPVAVVTGVALAPKTATNFTGTQHCVTATVTDQNGAPLEGIRVDFAASGANTASGFAFTNASGLAQFCYTGANVGGDTIRGSVGQIFDTAAKTWIEPARPATLVLAPKTATNVVGTEHCVVATVRDQRNDLFAGASVVFSVTGAHTVSGTVATGANGEARFCWTGANVGDDAITASVGALSDTAAKAWTPKPAVGRVFLALDEEARGQGKPVWAATPGDVLTLESGQTGDEGWFAPTCVPRKWLSGGAGNDCLEGADRDRALDNLAGLNGAAAIPRGSRLDKIPAVMPLRALGLTSLAGKNVCAVMFGSDVGVNYDASVFPFTSGSLQSRTHLVAFRVDTVSTARGSSSSLPHVSVAVLDPAACGDWQLFNAPVPRSSSEPQDTRAEAPAGVGEKAYLRLKTWPGRELFF